MRFRRVDAGLRDLLTGLVETLPLVQRRFDAEHAERLAAAAAVAAELGPGLADLVPPPARTVLAESTVETEMRWTGSRDVEVGVELLPLVYRRRYAHSGFTTSKVTLAVRQVPRAPATSPARHLEEEE